MDKSRRVFLGLFKKYIYLTVLDLSCSTWDLWSWSSTRGLLVLVCELLVAASRIQFPDQGLYPGPDHYIRNLESSYWATREVLGRPYLYAKKARKYNLALCSARRGNDFESIQLVFATVGIIPVLQKRNLRLERLSDLSAFTITNNRAWNWTQYG